MSDRTCSKDEVCQLVKKGLVNRQQLIYTIFRFISQGRVINTWADVLNRANLSFEVMHKRNAHNFPLDLAAGEAVPVALSAPAIRG